MKKRAVKGKHFLIYAASIILCLSILLLTGCSSSASDLTINEVTSKIKNYFNNDAIEIGDVETVKNNDGYGFNYMTYGTGFVYTYFGQADESKKVKNVNIMVTKSIGTYSFTDVDSLEKEMVDNSDLPTAEFVLSVSGLYNVLGGFDTKNSFKEVEKDVVDQASRTMNGWSFKIEVNEKNATVKAEYKG